MCGDITIEGNTLHISCLTPIQRWWHWWPPIDLTRFELAGDDSEDGPKPNPWKVDLTKIGDMLATVASLRNAALADRLGNVVAETGNGIAQEANIDVNFSWTGHS